MSTDDLYTFRVAGTVVHMLADQNEPECRCMYHAGGNDPECMFADVTEQNYRDLAEDRAADEAHDGGEW